jgi:hypothetical protein
MYDLFSSLKCKHCIHPLKRIFATSAFVFTRRTELSSFQWSHWSPIHILLRLLNLAFDSLFGVFFGRDLLPKYTEIYPNTPKYTQIYLNTPKYTQMYPNYTQIHPNILKCTIKSYLLY